MPDPRLSSPPTRSSEPHVRRSPRVVDFSTHLPGPIASSLIRDLGGDVIKVENPRTGDGLRDLPPLLAGVGHYHVGVNAGARSLAISHRSPHWPRVVEACARWADAVIVGGRPEDAKRRGLDFGAIRAANSEVIYCAVSAYGEHGPYASLKAHGLNVDVLAGAVPIDGDADFPRPAAGYRSAGTPLSGVFAALGIMGALYRRSLGEPPAYVSTSMWSAAMWWNWRDINAAANGISRPEYQDLGPRYAIYRTLDDKLVLICPIEEKAWVSFCAAAGLSDDVARRGRWHEGSHAEYGRDHPDERALIAAALRTRTRSDWHRILDEAEVPFAPVLSLEEAAFGEHAEAQALLREFTVGEQPVRVVASAVRLAESDAEPARRPVWSSPPEIGEHTTDVLHDIGLGDLNELDLGGS